MNSQKKIILMCLIPVILTIFFIVQFTMPAINKYIKLKQQIEREKVAKKNLENSLAILRGNKKLAKELEKINIELIGFDVEFPSEFMDEVILIDLEIFANEAVNRIVGVQSAGEKPVEIIDPEEEKQNANQRRSARNEIKETPPVQIIEKAFDINTVAYYNELIDFVKFLENYQRKVNIESITAKIFTDGDKTPNPKIDLKIRASTYMSIIQDKEEKEEESNEKSKR